MQNCQHWYQFHVDRKQNKDGILPIGFTTYKAVSGLLERKSWKLVNNGSLSTTLLSETTVPYLQSNTKNEELIFSFPHDIGNN